MNTNTERFEKWKEKVDGHYGTYHLLPPLVKYILNYFGMRSLLIAMVEFIRDNNPNSEKYQNDLESGLLDVLEKYESRYDND